MGSSGEEGVARISSACRCLPFQTRVPEGGGGGEVVVVTPTPTTTMTLMSTSTSSESVESTQSVEVVTITRSVTVSIRRPVSTTSVTKVVSKLTLIAEEMGMQFVADITVAPEPTNLPGAMQIGASRNLMTASAAMASKEINGIRPMALVQGVERVVSTVYVTQSVMVSDDVASETTSKITPAPVVPKTSTTTKILSKVSSMTGSYQTASIIPKWNTLPASSRIKDCISELHAQNTGVFIS